MISNNNSKDSSGFLESLYRKDQCFQEYYEFKVAKDDGKEVI